MNLPVVITKDWDWLREMERDLQRSAAVADVCILSLERRGKLSSKTVTEIVPEGSTGSVQTLSLGHVAGAHQNQYHVAMRLQNDPDSYIVIDGFLEPLDPVVALAAPGEPYNFMHLYDAWMTQTHLIKPKDIFSLARRMVTRLIKQADLVSSPEVGMYQEVLTAESSSLLRPASCDRERLAADPAEIRLVKQMLYGMKNPKPAT